MTPPLRPRQLTEKEYERRRKLQKLTKEQQLEARQLYNTQKPQPTIERLAQIYQVAPSTMWRILRKPFDTIK